MGNIRTLVERVENVDPKEIKKGPVMKGLGDLSVVRQVNPHNGHEVICLFRGSWWLARCLIPLTKRGTRYKITNNDDTTLPWVEDNTLAREPAQRQMIQEFQDVCQSLYIRPLLSKGA